MRKPRTLPEIPRRIKIRRDRMRAWLFTFRPLNLDSPRHPTSAVQLRMTV
ncbi:hypothetical protein AHF37_10158 [Paragonimus kellicotti]|nr:hypothetical protein AHF37_10158 [Paragonimus kellicotti]